MEHLRAVLVCRSGVKGLLKVSPQFLLCHMICTTRLVEFSRNVGLEVTSMVIRLLTKMTRAATS